ncbi:MAG: hypothetical protein R2856_37995 [Caldilineaceae bacterium]
MQLIRHDPPGAATQHQRMLRRIRSPTHLARDELAGRLRFVRGVNHIIPHAFYYSVRGIRRDERLPDVGPNSAWWDRFPAYADRCRRLSWLNTDAQHICEIAILGAADHLPWRPAKACFQAQRDFNYLEERHLWEDVTDENGVHLAGMTYRAVVLAHDADPKAAPALETLARAGRLIRYTDDTALINQIDALVPPDITVTPACPSLRVRHAIKDGRHIHLLFNEERAPVIVSVANERFRIARPLQRSDWGDGRIDLDSLSLAGYELAADPV